MPVRGEEAKVGLAVSSERQDATMYVQGQCRGNRLAKRSMLAGGW